MERAQAADGVGRDTGSWVSRPGSHPISPCTSAVGEASKVVLRSDCFDGPRAVADVAHSRGCPRSPRPQKPEKPVKPPQRPKPGCVTVCRHHRSPSAPGSQWKHCPATTRSLCRRSHHPTLLPLHVPPRQATSTSLARSAKHIGMCARADRRDVHAAAAKRPVPELRHRKELRLTRVALHTRLAPVGGISAPQPHQRPTDPGPVIERGPWASASRVVPHG